MKEYICPAYGCYFKGKKDELCPKHKVKVVLTLHRYNRYWIKTGSFRKVKDKPLRLEDL